jgi:hypothetical protein
MDTKIKEGDIVTCIQSRMGFNIGDITTIVNLVTYLNDNHKNVGLILIRKDGTLTPWL